MAKSLESALDEERMEILALLAGQQQAGRRQARGSNSSSGSRRTSSPFAVPGSPVRSMLDIDAEPVKHGKTNGNVPGSPRTVAVKSTSPHTLPIRSMLDITTTPGIGSTKSAQSSPTHHRRKKSGPTTSYIPHTQHAQHRSLSDTTSKPGFGPRSGIVAGNPEHEFKFSGYLQHNHGGAPKRNTLAKRTSAMAEVVRGGDLSQFGPWDRGRNHSIAGTGIGAGKSKSPHSRFSLRSRESSPHLKTDGSRIQLDDGSVIDMNNAYRRLSDANLAMSGGNLSILSKKARRKMSHEAGNDARLEKDYHAAEHEEAAVDSSEDEHRSSDADDEKPRGRKKNSRTEEKKDSPETQTIGMGRTDGPRTAQSQMAAAEEERIQVASKQQEKYKVRSLLDPEITVTTPSGERVAKAKLSSGVHPNTSFDEGASCPNTPFDSDTEADLTDIKRAQKLSINMTPITSTPLTSRCVRTIYRGDFAKMQQEAHDNQRRVRKYLVATDLSEEAAHALEWTIGTVLRDGDTLLAIYCVDEELGIAPNDTSGDDSAMAAQTAAIVASAKSVISTPILTATPATCPSPLGPGFKLDSHSSASASPMGRERGRAEQERYRAVQDITDRVARLLRKTNLQVKVVIEVIHCKSPKHLITEVIDYISPTLVILGSRGRSALKGVILGSFSNYLVTKSSVPVMVARKRLRKHSKYRRPDIRLANNLGNNLANPAVKSLASAKID